MTGMTLLAFVAGWSACMIGQYIRHLLLQQMRKRVYAATCYDCAWLDCVLEVLKRAAQAPVLAARHGLLTGSA